MCGEKLPKKNVALTFMGSPPLVRGKVTFALAGGLIPGITPACAGKRSDSCRNQPPRGDHPRLCGEKQICMKCASRKSGSPPLVRGKAPSSSARKRVKRITPACAGKSWIHPQNFLALRDHPRLCGEKFVSVIVAYWIVGSPPLVRGKESIALKPSPTNRITPACAGKRIPGNVSITVERDHPRLCGEK